MFRELIALIAASLEDRKILYIHKIFAGRPRDLEDVRSVLLRNRNADAKYIEKWLEEFDRSVDGKDFIDSFREIQAQIE